jgi:hypothetical protein
MEGSVDQQNHIGLFILPFLIFAIVFHSFPIEKLNDGKTHRTGKSLDFQ